MNIAAHSSGFVLKMKAMAAKNPQERSRLLHLANQQFTKALESNPDNKVSHCVPCHFIDSQVTLRNLGDCFSAAGQYAEAHDCYKRALSVDRDDTTSLFKFALSLDQAGHFDEAEEYYLKSLEACPTHSNCCYCYADFLWHQVTTNVYPNQHMCSGKITKTPKNFIFALLKLTLVTRLLIITTLSFLLLYDETMS